MAVALGTTPDCIPRLRIGLCQGRDIEVKLPDDRVDWVGDSARRATRATQHCAAHESEMLIHGAIVSAFSLSRDFTLEFADIRTRSGYENCKNEEPIELFSLISIRANAVAERDSSPYFVYTLAAIGDKNVRRTAEKAREQILDEAAAIRASDNSQAVERVLLPRLDLLVGAIPDASFLEQTTQLRRDYGFNTSPVGYNLHIRDSSTFRQALDWFERMRQDGIAPDLVTYNTLLSKAEYYATVETWFERMCQDGIAPNMATYNTLLSKTEYYATAEAWFERMRQDGIAPSVVTYNTLLSKTEDCATAEAWFDRMRQEGIAPNVVTYNTLVSKAEDYATAEAWFERMRQDGIAPNVVTYNTLLSKAEDYASAVAWFERMRVDGIAPNVVTYSTLVSKAEDNATAKAWFERMRQDGIAPSVVTYNTLISKAEDYATAKVLFARMREDGIAPDVVTYNTLISKAEDYATAKAWFERIRQDEIAPDQYTITALFNKDLSSINAEELLSFYWAQSYRVSDPLQKAIVSYRQSNRLEDALRIAFHYPHLAAACKLFRDFPQDTEDYLIRIFRDHPDHPDLEYALGVAFMEWGDRQKAETHLGAALESTNIKNRKRDIESRLRILGT